MSTGFKIFLAICLVAGIALYALVDWVLDGIRPNSLQIVEESMVDSVNQLAVIYADQWDDVSRTDLDAALRRAHERHFAARIYHEHKQRIDVGVYVTDAGGIVLFDSLHPEREGSDFSRWNDVYLTLRGRYGVRATPTAPDDPRSVVLHVAAPIRIDERIVGVVTLYKPAASVAGFMDRTRQRLMRTALGIAIAAVAASLLGAWWIHRPLRRFTAYVRGIDAGRRPPAPVLGDPDVRELAVAFEHLRDALEGRRYVERFVQNLTHEMKSPLSAIAGSAELLEEDLDDAHRARFLTNIRQSTERLRALVDRLLDLAALENRKALVDPEPVPVAVLATTIAEQLQPLLDRRDLRLVVEVPDDLTVRGEALLLRQCLRNLVQNAVDFSPDGGEITLRAQREAGTVLVTVTDDGPGVPAYARERVFERFYSLPRPGTGAKSSGLGLNFVREIAVLHGGDVTLDNRPSGGAIANLRLPV